MRPKPLSPSLRAQMLTWQRAEITGHHTYIRLAAALKDAHNREVIHQIGMDELRHYHIFKAYTGVEVPPNRLQVFAYSWIARLLGLTFGMKLLERGEDRTLTEYARFRDEVPELDSIIREEEEHEHRLLAMLDEEILKYTGSVVLGLNDALVELTGALAGLSFAFQNTRLIALTGLITGISASLSMAASEYLSTRAEGSQVSPIRSAVYTGLTYVFTVAVLVLPYFVLDRYLLCLGWTLVNAILVIGFFNFYLAVAKDLEFGKRFLEMTAVSMGVAAFSFAVGYAIRQVLGVEL